MAKLDGLLMHVPEKDRADVRTFMESKVASGFTENSTRTITFALARLSRMTKKRLAASSRDDVVALMASLQGEAKNASWYIRALKEFLLYFDREDALRKLPKRNGSRTTAGFDSAKLLTRDDIARAIGKSHNTRDRALLGVAWDLGSRIHEIVAIDVGDLELRGRGKDAVFTVMLRKQKVRGSERRLPLHESTQVLRSYLASHPDRANPHAPLFVGYRRGFAGVRLSTIAARSVIHSMFHAAGIEKPSHPHWLRHSRVADLKKRGVSEESIRLWFGWSRRSRMLERYGGLAVDDAASEVEAKFGYKPLPQPAPTEDLDKMMRELSPEQSEVATLRREIEDLKGGIGVLVSMVAKDRGIPVGTKLSLEITKKEKGPVKAAAGGGA
jgi:site-specific recombinase XerD